MRRALILFPGALAFFWLAGLLGFVTNVARMEEPPVAQLESADAIVVLTGGSDRVTTGLTLLNAGKGKKLFISGVHPGLTLDHLIGTQQVTKELRDCCIVLGIRRKYNRQCR